MSGRSGAWEEYLAAAQRLDAVRRGAATAAGEQAQAAQTARDELTGVRARLAPQESRLRDLGAPEADLRPSSAEVAAAAETMVDGPGAVLAALRRARATADAADATVVGTGPVALRAPSGTAGWPGWLRNLLVYGPFALVVLVVQITLYLTAGGESASLNALLCGLAMPAVAFGLGWVTIGLVFPPGPNGRVDRTAVLGAAVCAAPIAVTCVGAAALRIVS